LLLLISLLYLTGATGDPRARQMIRFHVIHMNFSLNIVLQFLVMFKISMIIFLLLIVIVRLLLFLVIVGHGIVMM